MRAVHGQGVPDAIVAAVRGINRSCLEGGRAMEPMKRVIKSRAAHFVQFPHALDRQLSAALFFEVAVDGGPALSACGLPLIRDAP